MIAHAFALGWRSLLRLHESPLDQWQWGAASKADDQFDNVYYVMADGTAGIAKFSRVHAMPGDYITVDFSKLGPHKKYLR